MKKNFEILLFAILLQIPFILNAQDTIIFRNGDELVVKVTEVSDTYIKYNLWNNLSGPVYSKNIYDIFMVKYRGGHKDVYGTSTVPNNAKPSVTNTVVPPQYKNSKMERSGNDLELNGEEVGEDILRQVLTADEFETYSSAHRQFRLGKGLMIPGAVLSGLSFPFWLTGAILMGISTNYVDFYLGYDFLVTGITFFSVGQGFLAAGVPLMVIGGKRLNWVADSFNQRASGNGISLQIEPMMFRNPDRSSAHGVAFGAGLTLNF